jgi:hypothetical protein
MLTFNHAATKMYWEAQRLGNPRREEAIQKVREGIACFDSVMDAIRDAEHWINCYTRSDFMAAHFYELVRSEALKLLLGAAFGRCHTCHHWRADKCGNRSLDAAKQTVFDEAGHDGTCGYYYPGTPASD